MNDYNQKYDGDERETQCQLDKNAYFALDSQFAL
jgi:hypothetical protein